MIKCTSLKIFVKPELDSKLQNTVYKLREVLEKLALFCVITCSQICSNTFSNIQYLMTETRQVTRQLLQPTLTYVAVASFFVVVSAVLFR